jgi:hypothetical protein
MGISESLKDTYYKAEDAWYRLVDKISDKLPAFGAGIDKIEEKGVPTFPAMVALLLLIIIGIIILFSNQGSALIINAVDSDGEAISGAIVTVELSSGAEEILETNSLGKASFYLTAGEYNVKIEREGYQTVTRTGVSPGGEEKIFTLVSQVDTLTSSVALKNASGQLINGSGTVIYSCVGSSEQRYATYENGRFNADFSDCSEIQIDSITGYTIIQGNISFEGNDSATVDEVEQETATITVSLTSEEDVSGVKVNLYNDEGTLVKSTTASTEVVIFNDVITDEYYVRTIDPNGNFNDYDGSSLGDIKEVSANETESFNVVLTRSNSSTITVTVKDAETGIPISGAEIRRTSNINQDDLDTQITGNSGQVTFNVPAGNEYTLIADHPNYIIPSSQRVSSGGVAIFDLIEATEENSQSLIVNINDPRGDGIKGTRVVLKKTDDTKVDEKITGANGEVTFYNLEIGNYFVFATKPGFDSTTSPTIQILPRRATTSNVTLDIGVGIIRLNVSDGSGALPGASVMAYDIEGDLIEEKTTDAEGKVDFSVRVDRTVYFKISSPGLADYYTTLMRSDEGVLTEKIIIMQNDVAGLGVELVSLYSLAGEVEDDDETTLSVGNYTAKLLLSVPSGNFNEAGVHIRTGKSDVGITNLIEEDAIALGSISAPTTKLTRGSTYTPNTGYGTDSKNFTSVSGPSKWANIIINNPSNAVYEIEAEVLITDSTISRAENFWYRAWAKGSSNLFNPSNNVNGNELYASARNRLFTLDSTRGTNICGNSFCKIYSVETLTGKNAGRVAGITNRINASQNNSYNLIAELVNVKSISNAVLNIEASGVNVDEIRVNGQSFDSEEILLGNISIDTYTRVEVEFTTDRPGDATIKFDIDSALANEFSSTILVDVKANKKFELDVIPRQIIPYIDNTLFFTATDGNTPLRGVIIEIIQDNSTLGIVETTSDGVAEFVLTYPTPGDEITILAKKDGYDDVEIDETIDERILLITPSEIEQTIKIGEVTSIDETIILTNLTISDLDIERVSISGEIDDYLDIDTREIEGTIESGVDSNYNIKLKINSRARRLSEPLTIEGTLKIDVSAEDVSQTFENEIPIRIRLSMPGFLDSDRCLKVNPSTIEFNTSTNEETATIEVTNNCVAEGIKVNLFDLEARLSEASKLGTVIVSGEGFLNATLGENYSTIAEIFESDASQNLVVRFIPNASVISGDQEIKVDLRASNVADEDTTESVDTSFNMDIAMSNLNKCIEVEQPSGGLILEIAGWNLGYDRLLTSNLSSVANNYQGFNGGRNSMYGRQTAPFGLNQMLPFTGLGGGNQTYEQDKFTIKNNCAVDIEVDLDPDSRLNVGEEKFTIGRDSDTTISVSPGYTLGKYRIGVNAKVAGSDETKRKVDNVDVTVRKLGELDPNCIKVNVSTLNFNSFIYKSERHKVFNYCYNTGTTLDRSNSAVTVQCEAPDALTSGISYFQTGNQFSNIYDQQYPLGGTANSYHDYLRPTGNPTNSCPMVSGTRVYDYRVNGDVEELTFEVLPSARYLPQRKLFDNQRNTFGLFNSISDIRQWATETDARTNIYGNLAVRYTNQYGSMQTMHFPIEIEDIFRIGESIDSAINWGDPNASPQSCVDSEREKESLNIEKYWKDRGNNKGAIPEGEYKENGNYIHISEPPAVKIGAPRSTNIYPNPQGRATPSELGGGNCGLLDNLDNFEYQENWGGVTVSITDMKKGSILNNTLGPNLVTTINRNGIQHNCVYIDTVVTADLTRAINLQKGQVSWNLKAVVTKPGYNLRTTNPSVECYTPANEGLDCESLIRTEISKNPETSSAEILAKVVADYPACDQRVGTGTVDRIKQEQEESVSTCESDPSEFGFDKINKVTLESLTDLEINDYCNNNFCSTDMFSGFIYNKYIDLKEKIADAEDRYDFDGSGNLSEIYKEASTIRIGENDYYTRLNNTLIEEVYRFSEEDLEGRESVKDASSAQTTAKPINDMIGVLGTINNNNNEVFLKVTNDATHQSDLNKLGTIVENSAYISLEKYIEINENASDNYSDLLNAGSIMTLDDGTIISADLVKYLAENGNLVKLVNEEATDGDKERITKVYEANRLLREVYDLAQDDDIYLANINTSISAPREVGNVTYDEVDGYNTTISGSEGIGKYSLEIDLNYLDIDNSNLNVRVNLSNYEVVNSASENVLLISDFDLSSSTSKVTNTIADNEGIYSNVPATITTTLNAQQESLSYRLDTPVTVENSNLINWTYNGNALNESGNNASGYVISVPIAGSAKTLNARTYIPHDSALLFEQVQIGSATITMKGNVLTNQSISRQVTTGSATSLQFTNVDGINNVSDVVKLVKEDNACVVNGSIIWNESNLE